VTGAIEAAVLQAIGGDAGANRRQPEFPLGGDVGAQQAGAGRERCGRRAAAIGNQGRPSSGSAALGEATRRR
jgi:hypothetical protein